MRRLVAAAAFVSLAPFLPHASGSVGAVSEEWIVTLDASASAEVRSAALETVSLLSRVRRSTFLVAATKQQRGRLPHAAGVIAVQPNQLYHAEFTPNDPYFPYQWNISQIDVPQAWDLDTTPPLYAGDPSIVVAVLDTGLAYESFTDPNPGRCLNGGAPSNCVSSNATYAPASDLGGTAVAAGFDFINDDSHPNDDNGHGTHVSGTIAGTGNNGTGVAGVAFASTLLPVKVLDRKGEGTTASITQGIDFARTHGAAVINLSLGSTIDDPVLHAAITTAANAGIVVVAAAGNSNASTLNYPAAYSEVVSVGAVRFDRARAFYSNYGSGLDLVAPGGDLGVDQNGDGQPDGVLQQSYSNLNGQNLPNDFTTFDYLFEEGTSMAAPHVSGAVALLRAAGASGVSAVSALSATAQDLGTPGADTQFGAGLIDVQAALAGITAPEGTPFGSIRVANGAVAVADPGVTLTFSASVSGSTVTEMAVSEGGTPSSFEPFATSKSWTLTDTDGSHTISVIFKSAAGTPSSVFSDSIILDRTRPEPWTDLSLFTNASRVREFLHRRLGSQDSVWGAWSGASDTGSGVVGAAISVTRKPQAPSGPPSAASEGAMPPVLGTGKWYVNLVAVDYAGNRSRAASFAIQRAPSRAAVMLANESPRRMRVIDDRLSVLRRTTLSGIPDRSPAVGADLDGDGQRRLVVASANRDQITVLRFDGTVRSVWDNRIGGIPVSIAAGDLTNDGRDELLVGTSDGRIVVFGPTGRRLRTDRPFGAESVGILTAVGNLRGSSTPEIVATRASGRADVRILTPSGSRIKTFLAAGATYRGGLSLAVADFDGDGTNSIAVAPRSRATPEVRLYNVAGAKIRTVSYPVRTVSGGLVLAADDVDGNGSDDLWVGPRTGRGPLALLRDGRSATSRSGFGSTPVSSVVLAAVRMF